MTIKRGSRKSHSSIGMGRLTVVHLLEKRSLEAKNGLLDPQRTVFGTLTDGSLERNEPCIADQ